MTALRTAAQQALEALELGYDSAKSEADQYHAAMAGYRPQRHAEMDAEVQQIARAITDLRAALAEPEQEPVAWALHTGTRQGIKWNRKVEHGTPLYPAPPQRKPLSGLEVERLLEHVIGSLPAARRLVRAIERAHGIGESNG